MVLTGVVNDPLAGRGLNTLALVFRGTDQGGDVKNFTNFQNHYQKFAPLIGAIERYINDDDEGDTDHQIEQVIVAGHSLGAAMVEYFLADHFSTAQYKMKAYTAGSPGSGRFGSEAEADVSPYVINFIHTDDIVTKVPFISSPAGKALAVTFGAAIATGAFAAYAPLGVGAVALQGALVGLAATMDRKYRGGSEVLINSEISSSAGAAEHNSDTYTADVATLQAIAADPASPFAGSVLASHLLNNSTNNGGFGGPVVPINLQLAVGSNFQQGVPNADGNDVIHRLPTTAMISAGPAMIASCSMRRAC
jgi:hypothetical protein